MRIYVASSWRNDIQQAVVAGLRAMGHDTYDFKNPPNKSGFSWTQVTEAQPAVDGKRRWSAGHLNQILQNPIAQAGFDADMLALRECEACVLVLPCGRSAHLELGWATGNGRRTIVLMPDPDEPELMYLMCDAVCSTLSEVREALKGFEPDDRTPA